MSKVLVDRELLEKWADKLEGAESAGYGWEDMLAAEVRGAVAQPAEVDGASIPPTGEYHIDCSYLMNLVDGQRAALSDVTAERDRLREALNFACKALCKVTSSDGSGHADIALSVLRLAGVGADEREAMVEGWKANVKWRADAAMAAKEG